MINFIMIERKRAEIKKLIKFRSHVSTLKITIELPDDFAEEIITKINDKIEQNERLIQAYQKAHSDE
jgi:hypothetical protein